MYQLTELITNMPISIAELVRRSGVDERTLLRMRRGERVQRANAVKVLNALADIYDKEYNLQNVEGINYF
jgi:hypothetical protein